jgi:hypothetical protein
MLILGVRKERGQATARRLHYGEIPTGRAAGRAEELACEPGHSLA